MAAVLQRERSDTVSSQGRAISLEETASARFRDPDAHLVRRARHGDPDAFDELYRSHVGRVYAICLRMSADRETAERLTQDTFVRCWEKIGTFRERSRFSSWLYRLAVNIVLNDQRSRKRRRRREVSEPNLGRHGHAAPGGRAEERIDVERALARLPESARAALVLYGIEGYKYREIAEMMGVAVGTVKAQIHRARTLLGEMLKERDGHDG